MKPVMFCTNSSGIAAAVAELDEVRSLERGLAEEDAVVGEDPDGMAVDVGERADQRLAVELLELMQLGAVDDRPQHLADVVGGAAVQWHQVEHAVGRDCGHTRRPALPAGCAGRWQRRDDLAHDLQRVVVVLREVIGDAGGSRVQVAAAELLGRDHLAGRGLDQRRSAEKDRALIANDHGLVAHRRHVRAAGGAGAHHAGDLRDRRSATSSPG